jgi:hypothetical protein
METEILDFSETLYQLTRLLFSEADQFQLPSNKKKIHYTPWRRLGGKGVELLLIPDLGTARVVIGHLHAPAAL